MVQCHLWCVCVCVFVCVCVCVYMCVRVCVCMNRCAGVSHDCGKLTQIETCVLQGLNTICTSKIHKYAIILKVLHASMHAAVHWHVTRSQQI